MCKVSIVIPLYNEQQVLPLLHAALLKELEKFGHGAEVLFVDDGSTDSTPELIMQLALADGRFSAISFSRNFGHGAAITAGLEHARGSEAVMIMDGDLQDPPEMLHRFYEGIKAGYDVVYAVRMQRKENALKRSAYYFFYRLLSRIATIEIPPDSGDFCMISRRSADVLNAMPEKSRFVRGMRAWIGFKQLALPYERLERKAGKTKYSFRKLVRLASDGIFNFSDIPIRLIFLLGVIVLALVGIYFMYAIYRKFMHAETPQGFTGLLAVIVLFSGVQLISLGVIGEYVVRIFYQMKQRPVYLTRWVVREGRRNE